MIKKRENRLVHHESIKRKNSKQYELKIENVQQTNELKQESMAKRIEL